MTTPAPCPRCGSRVPPEGGVCLSCGAGPAIPPVAANTGPLAVGHAFGPRYRILKPVGTGGTSAVYQAWDAEMNEAVALKVSRPDALADPHTALEVERRFTRELGLARQVTHRNVVRIHDMGEIGGVRGGRVCLIYPCSRMVEAIHRMRVEKMEPKRLRMVHSRPGSRGDFIIVEGMKGGGEELAVLPPLFVYREDERYSEELEVLFRNLSGRAG